MTGRFLLTALCAVWLCLLPFAFGQAQAQDQARDSVYPLQALNDGLGRVPDAMDRATPRSTMESLIFAARTGRWRDAAHLLNLNEYRPSEHYDVGAELARRLEVVIDRKAVVDWDDLLDRPDALDATGPGRNAAAGKPRRSILLWTLQLDGKPAAIRLNRVQVGEAAPVWVFSRQTVQNIDALYRVYGPSWLERQLPKVFHTEAILGLMLWELLGLPVLIALAAAAGLIVRAGLNLAARWVNSPVLTDIYRAIRGPAIFGTFVAVMSVGTRSLFVFSGRIDTILTPLVTLGIAASVLWLVTNAIDAILDRLVHFRSDALSQNQLHAQRSLATKVAAGRRAIIVVFVATALGIALSSTTFYQNLGLSLIGTAGALTLVLGFAARRILGNIMSSMQIALNQSARIGDRLVYRDHLCHVERINFTYVQLRNWDGARIVVPVEQFVSEVFDNWTLQTPEMLRTIKLRIAHDADVQTLRDAFHAVIEELDQEQLADLDRVVVRVADQDVFGMEVWFCLPCADPNTSWDVTCLAREKLMARLADIARSGDTPVFPDAQPAEAA